jgi:hypothetical protein
MKTIFFSLLLSFFITGQALAIDLKKNKPSTSHFEFGEYFERMDVDIENDTLILRSNDSKSEYVEFTPDHQLIVNGSRIELNNRQQKMVLRYHESFFSIVDEAKEIAKEGAKIGLAGARIGLQALANTIRLVSDDFDSEDFEHDMNCRSKEIEEKADLLEERADRLEEQVETLEKLHTDLRQSVKELDELEWF